MEVTVKIRGPSRDCETSILAKDRCHLYQACSVLQCSLCGSDAAGWWQLAGAAPLGPFYPLQLSEQGFLHSLEEGYNTIQHSTGQFNTTINTLEAEYQQRHWLAHYSRGHWQSCFLPAIALFYSLQIDAFAIARIFFSHPYNLFA